MITWDSKCPKCKTVTHVPMGTSPSTSCPRCKTPTEAKILHTGVNRKNRRRMEVAQRTATKRAK